MKLEATSGWKLSEVVGRGCRVPHPPRRRSRAFGFVGNWQGNRYRWRGSFERTELAHEVAAREWNWIIDSSKVFEFPKEEKIVRQSQLDSFWSEKILPTSSVFSYIVTSLRSENCENSNASEMPDLLSNWSLGNVLHDFSRYFNHKHYSLLVVNDC